MATDDDKRTDLGRSLRVPQRDRMSRGCRRSATARSHRAGLYRAGGPGLIDVFLIICLSLPVLMLVLAVTYDARRRARDKAKASLRPGLPDHTIELRKANVMNEIAKHNSAVQPADVGLAEQLEEYGIVTVPAATYEWGGFRYTNAREAIAAAKRGRS